MKENNYSVRYLLKYKEGGYSQLISISENGNTVKYTLEEARKVAREKLEAGTLNAKAYVPYCKIYNGKTFIEKIEK